MASVAIAHIIEKGVTDGKSFMKYNTQAKRKAVLKKVIDVSRTFSLSVIRLLKVLKSP